MARYTGPKTRIARRFKEAIFGPDKWMERKPHAPGQHGPNARRRKKESEYNLQLQEKQKAKYMYGILERQFEKMYHLAASKRGITGAVLLQLCEARLDNTVYRLGIAPTRRAARQLVSHGHITVDEQVVTIASYSLRAGQTIAVRERSRSLEAITNSVSVNSHRYDWLEWNPSQMAGKMIALPERAQIPENIREQLIVELYSK
ncbi:MAG: 30S ribosomal protein S4 [Flavobacteriales bacterium]|mgnify:CR=1 FL=1|jgi:small subunit ribosomal protein S4|nr:30S ribosomal protein S4 [Flavobacteriales bacterium]MBK6882989.1 30S ribosomal protein S4 [Flavobacteriales bacterium]MBK7101975.1 30S ribosomal protein S4 [Flavobacteriales bacterium]MBK7114326.1 30S ribosomal protein S4 [Flavobacteriales bacterium]MBK7483613.1 30S ribosomal protein S4 [Flavobacteriales bacterium]